MANPSGTCQICGAHGPLSFEHVPPKKAFNNRPVFRALVERIEDEYRVTQHGKQNKGLGGNTLCERCNNSTGRWYGTHFVPWTVTAATVLENAGEAKFVPFITSTRPLRVLKQIATMFFTVNGPNFHTQHPELAHFVLNHNARLAPKFKFFLYFMEGNSLRFNEAQLVGRGDFSNPTFSHFGYISDFSFPPFGYVLTVDQEMYDYRPQDISFFGRYGPDEDAEISLVLPVLPTHGMLIGGLAPPNIK